MKAVALISCLVMVLHAKRMEGQQGLHPPRAYRNGSILYLETVSGSDTARVGLDARWGGSITTFSIDGEDLVNRFDTGREVQVGLWDGDQEYDTCAGCTGVFGWDPVQAGDRYVNGSPVLVDSVGNGLLYAKTRPYEWFPTNKGGNQHEPILSDVYIEQWLTAVAGAWGTFRLHYRITHFGPDHHGNALQELPAVYVNRGLDRFVYYSGAVPWTGDSVTIASLAARASHPAYFYLPEHWASFVNDQGVGLTVYVPYQFSYGLGRTEDGTSGPAGNGFNYYRPVTPFTFGPHRALEVDVFLVAGAVGHARDVVYDLRRTLPPADVFPPFGQIDTPVTYRVVRGVARVTGWAIDDEGVTDVQVAIDDVVLLGAATYGLSRPDVQQLFPHAPIAVGYEYTFDSTRLSNGPHRLSVHVADRAGNVAVFPSRLITVTN